MKRSRGSVAVFNKSSYYDVLHNIEHSTSIGVGKENIMLSL